MKKLLCFVLSLVLIAAAVLPAFALGSGTSSYTGEYPVILISGDGDSIVDPDGNLVMSVGNILTIVKGETSENSSVKEAAKNIIEPLLLEGVLFDKWDNYYDALYSEIKDLFEKFLLDGDGNAQYGTDISQFHRNENARLMQTDQAQNGQYRFENYHFWYDWRLDPIQIADELHEYIEAIKAVTGKSKVGITTRCLGSSVLFAYISKYGTDSIKGIGIDGLSSGSEFISGVLSGEFGIDGNSISRYLSDARVFEIVDTDPLIQASLELLQNSGVMNNLTATARKLIYAKIELGVISALARSTFLTMPCYWALVSTDKFEKAKNYVFGDESSQKRQDYAGLIEKIDNYNETIKKNIPNIITEVSENGGTIAIVSKYGTQMVPIIKNANFVADEYASVAVSSLGATTSTLYDTLSDEYINTKISEGKGKYISPDRQIDGSTALFPDYTWYVKGVSHSNWSLVENNIVMKSIQSEEQIIASESEWTQFIIAYQSQEEWEPMTAENCNTENWEANSKIDTPKTKTDKLTSFIKSVIKVFVLVFEKLVGLIKK